MAFFDSGLILPPGHPWLVALERGVPQQTLLRNIEISTGRRYRPQDLANAYLAAKEAERQVANEKRSASNQIAKDPEIAKAERTLSVQQAKPAIEAIKQELVKSDLKAVSPVATGKGLQIGLTKKDLGVTGAPDEFQTIEAPIGGQQTAQVPIIQDALLEPSKPKVAGRGVQKPGRLTGGQARTKTPSRRGMAQRQLLGQESAGGTTVTRPGLRQARPKLALFGE